MASKVSYQKLDVFNEYLDMLVKGNETFELWSTNYSKTIIINGEKIYFNDDGKNNFGILGLIAKVRMDAKHFLEKEEWNRERDIDFFKLLNIPNHQEVISKIDIKAAYWNYALKNGVVSEATNKYFNEKFEGLSFKEVKNARLKALGSLATKKKKLKYINGLPDYESEIIERQPTIPLYMNICNGIDELMKKCHLEVPGCQYYYWDCVFIKKQFCKEAIDFFMDNKFQVGVEETRLNYIKIGEHGYLVSDSDGKMYMTRKENKELIW